jgi:hypothetical protein
LRNPARVEDFTRSVVGRGEASQDTADRLLSTLNLGSQVHTHNSGGGVVGGGGVGDGGFFGQYRAGGNTAPAASRLTAETYIQDIAAAANAKLAKAATEIKRYDSPDLFWGDIWGNGSWTGRGPYAEACDQHLKCILFLQTRRGFATAEEYNFLVLSGVRSGFIDFEWLTTRPEAVAGAMKAALHYESIHTARLNVLEGTNCGPGHARGRSSAAPRDRAATATSSTAASSTASRPRAARPAASASADKQYCTACRKEFAHGSHNFGDFEVHARGARC